MTTLYSHQVLQHGRTLIQTSVKAARDALDRLDAGCLACDQALVLVAAERAAVTHGVLALASLLRGHGALREAGLLEAAKEQALTEIGCIEDAIRLFAHEGLRLDSLSEF